MSVLLSGSGFLPALRVKRCRIDNEIGEALGSQLDAEKVVDRPVRLVRSHCFVQRLQSYYRELVKVLE